MAGVAVGPRVGHPAEISTAHLNGGMTVHRDEVSDQRDLQKLNVDEQRIHLKMNDLERWDRRIDANSVVKNRFHGPNAIVALTDEPEVNFHVYQCSRGTIIRCSS